MKVYYTLWNPSQLKSNDRKGVRELISRCRSVDIHGLVVVIAMTYDGKYVDFAHGKYPFLSMTDLVNSLLVMREQKFPYILKFQLHPCGESYQGLEPQWWPGWLESNSIIEVWFKSAWTAIAEWAARLVGYDPDVLILGAEMDALAQDLPWKDTIGNLKKRFSNTLITYGTNFWQPLRQKYWLPILILHWLRKDEEILQKILKLGLYKVSPDRLRFAADQVYKSLLPKAFWKRLDRTGLSCYWYPSMLESSMGKMQDAYLNYRAMGLEIDYLQTVRDWVAYTGRPLMITESGVLYNAPIAQDKEAVKDWFRVAISYFREMADIFCIWEDTHPGWVLEEKLW